ncbi:hypothetical protein J7M23_11700, partial [Candidatus Sumerlaeota bacterium]|nr:hypothetical protein [Candidatus Sumerlaeota bacterium]
MCARVFSLIALLLVSTSVFAQSQQNWKEIGTSNAPSPRQYFAMAFCEATSTTILFGGSIPGVNYNDTWEYDGNNWRELFPATIPPEVFAPAMTYDNIRKRIVMWGGGMHTGYLLDTYEYYDGDWHLVTTPQRPGARRGHRLAFDKKRGVVVMYGGEYYSPGTGATRLFDTWEYDGTNWTQIFTPHHPNASSWYAMAYDEKRQKIVLYGGRGI